MARGKTIDRVAAEVDEIIQVWADNSKFTMGDITIDVAREKVAGLRNLGDETATLRLHLTAKVNETEALLAELKDFITRARSGVRSFFGPDSTQYEQVGGTRKSERGKKKANKGGKAGTDNKN